MKKNVFAKYFLLVFTLVNLEVSIVYANDRTDDKFVIHFILDGLNKEIFSRVYSENKMPNLKKLVEQRGIYPEHVIANLPTVSTSLYQGFASGLYPGFSGIPHLERYDKVKKTKVDYLSAKDRNAVNSDFLNLNTLTNSIYGKEDTPTTIFELLGDLPSASIYSTFKKGAKYVYPKNAPIKALFSVATGTEENLDVLTFVQIDKLFNKEKSKIPRYTLVGLYTIDLLGHLEGPYSKDIEYALIRFDLYLKSFIELLKRQNILDKTMIIISADHGMHDTNKLFKLKRELKKLGIRVVNGRHGNGDLFVVDRGVSSSMLYSTKHNEIVPMTYWKNFPTMFSKKVNLIDKLLAFDATEFVILKEDYQTVSIFGKDNSQAKIKCTNVKEEIYCAYLPINRDPLKYTNDKSTSKLINNKTHSEDTWLYYTAQSEYPDAVVQIWQMFADGRSGDLFLTLKKPYGLRKIKYGNHGGIGKDDMDVPEIIIYPEKPEVVNNIIFRSNDTYKIVADFLQLNTPSTNAKHPFERSFNDNYQLQILSSKELSLPESSTINRLLLKEEITRRKNIINSLDKRKIDVTKNNSNIQSVIDNQVDYWTFALKKLENIH